MSPTTNTEIRPHRLARPHCGKDTNPVPAGVLVLGLFVLWFFRRHPQAVAIASLLVAGGTVAA